MCPTPRRCACSLTDGSRRRPLEPWDGLAAHLGLLTTEGWLPSHVFESDEAARQNSDRPEQTAWWEQTATLFTDEPVFHNSTSVEVDTPGDPSQAGFVQVMQGRSSDPGRARELMANDPTDWQEFRPDILGTVSVGHDGGAWTMAIYFTS